MPSTACRLAVFLLCLLMSLGENARCSDPTGRVTTKQPSWTKTSKSSSSSKPSKAAFKVNTSSPLLLQIEKKLGREMTRDERKAFSTASTKADMAAVKVASQYAADVRATIPSSHRNLLYLESMHGPYTGPWLMARDSWYRGKSTGRLQLTAEQVGRLSGPARTAETAMRPINATFAKEVAAAIGMRDTQVLNAMQEYDRSQRGR